MKHFPENPSNFEFFTLTELVAAWTEQDADEQTLTNRRRVVRRNTVERGCPHTKIGIETLFTTKRFAEWLIENEEPPLASA